MSLKSEEMEWKWSSIKDPAPYVSILLDRLHEYQTYFGFPSHIVVKQRLQKPKATYLYYLILKGGKITQKPPWVSFIHS